MKFLVEGVGTLFLVAVVVGSGIMAENLANGNNAVALLGNTIATGSILFVLIKMFGPISGAHFNPAVSLVFWVNKKLSNKDFFYYVLSQIIFGLVAIFIIHYIFGQEIVQVSSNIRGEIPLLISEIIATFGLIITILFVSKHESSSVATAVALFITAGYWFTSSTSFANPAVTIARIFTDTFTGIAPESSIYFLVGQIIGALLALKFYNLINENRES